METQTIYKNSENMTMDEVAALLVQLYAAHRDSYGQNDKYAKAVGIAIRMLSD